MTMRIILALERHIKPYQGDTSGLLSPRMSVNILPPAHNASATNPTIEFQRVFFIPYQYLMNGSLTSQWTLWVPYPNKMVSTQSSLSWIDSRITSALNEPI